MYNLYRHNNTNIRTKKNKLKKLNFVLWAENNLNLGSLFQKDSNENLAHGFQLAGEDEEQENRRYNYCIMR